jgi:citrate lyase subunit beta/citryl-CoA lyase
MLSPVAWLYVPAVRPDLFSKAADSADGVVIDLEDAVHPEARVSARLNLAELERLAPKKPAVVRVNAVRTSDFLLDVAAISPLVTSGLVEAIRLPKVDSPDDVRFAADATQHWGLDRPLLCQLETARGVGEAFAIAKEPGVQGIMLGEADLRVDLGVPRGPDGEEGLMLARQTIVMAARAGGLPAPTGSAYTNVRDLDGLRTSSELLSRLGFGGRSCLHPAQVDIVRKAFRPSPADLEWADAVLNASVGMNLNGSAAAALEDGTFVDPAIVHLAQNLRDREEGMLR